MHNKYFKDLDKKLQNYINNKIIFTIRIAEKKLSKKQIECFFQQRQQTCKTTTAEHLNSCVTSELLSKIKSFIKDNEKTIVKAGFINNKRFTYVEAIARIIRVYDSYKVNVDTTPSQLKFWFINKCAINNIDNKFQLVSYVLELLGNMKFKGGNKTQHVYTSIAYYIMSECYNQISGFNNKKIEKIREIYSNYSSDTVWQLTPVGGDHSSKHQRDELKSMINNILIQNGWSIN